MTLPVFAKKSALSFLAAIAISAGAVAQQQTDPYGGGAASGAVGLQPRSDGPADIGNTSGRADHGKPIQFKSQATFIEVPVLVTDKAGNHIHDLTKADFKILENGKPQTITLFAEVLPTGGLGPAAAPADGIFTNISRDESEPHSLAVILLDEVNTPFLSQAYARAQLVKYLASHLQPAQPVGLMVLSGRGLATLSGLDTDPGELISALKKASGQVSKMETFSNDAQAIAAAGNAPDPVEGLTSRKGPPELVIRRFVLNQDAIEATYSQARAIESTLRGFLEIAWSLSGTPGRKSLVWVTGSFPFYLDSFTSVPGDNNLRALYERTLKALNEAQISIYPVDARGLPSDPKYAGDTEGSLLSPDAPDSLQQSKVDSLKTFAEMTGGIAYFNTNDLSGAFDRAVKDSSSYYLLGYYPDHRDTKAGWQKLQVVVSRKDVEVRARAGYLVTNVSENPDLTRKADLALALKSPFESTSIQIQARWEAVLAKDPKKKVGFTLRVPEPGLVDETNQNYVDLDFVAQATKLGAIAGTVSQTFKGRVAPETLAKLKTDGVLYKNTIDLAPGDYQVHFVVRDNLSGRVGSLIVPLTVN